MDHKKLIERLMVTFLGELVDHVRTINEELLALEKSPDDPAKGERYKSLFRAAHSLKGAARSVGEGLIEEACHGLEEVLTTARDGTRSLDPEAFATLFAAADAIEDAGNRLKSGKSLAGSPLAEILPRLEHAGASASAHAATAPPPARPQQTPMPVEAAPAPPPRPAETATGRDAPERRQEAPVNTSARPHEGPGFVRVPAEKLDALLTWSGELLVARRRFEAHEGELDGLRRLVEGWADGSRVAARRARRGAGARAEDPRGAQHAEVRLRELADKLAGLTRVMADNRRQLARAAGRLTEEVRNARMLPFAEACQGLDRTARDVARAAGKAVELAVEGGAVELDRSVLEWLKDPLVHLVRNAVDHGLEAPDIRAAAGKPAAGRVTVKAAVRGDLVEVVVADDGGGLDPEALRRAARERGLAEPSDAFELADLIFLPGLSTAAAVTNFSGRGVGLDVVKSRLEGLHGTIDVATEPGRGTRFVLTVPLTLTALRALIVHAGGQVFALPGASVQRLVRVDAADLRPSGGRPTLLLGEHPVPVASLAATLGIAGPPPDPAARKTPAVVVAAGERRLALLVDELMSEQEIVIKSLGGRIRRVRNVSGATILPSGRVALVLNVASLVRSSLAQGPSLPTPAPARAPSARKRLLVVDDSLTTRTLEKSILEGEGYEVLTAVDGEDGWRVLREAGADLVISDVEMPWMNGFALTETIRASPRFAALPVILFSSLASDGDKARGNAVGADAYIVKGAFDQRELLETVSQLI